MINKGHNSVTNLQKWMHNDHNLDVVKVNEFENFDQIPLNCYQDIEWKPNFHKSQGP